MRWLEIFINVGNHVCLQISLFFYFFYFFLIGGCEAGLCGTQQWSLQSQKVLLENIMVMFSTKNCFSLKKEKSLWENKKICQRKECSLQENSFFICKSRWFQATKFRWWMVTKLEYKSCPTQRRRQNHCFHHWIFFFLQSMFMTQKKLCKHDKWTDFQGKFWASF